MFFRQNKNKFNIPKAIFNHLGINNKQERVGFSRQDRGNHTHIIGSTGTGKSKFLELLIRQDVRNKGAGFCLIDPHGSLYDDIVHYISHRSPRVADRVVLFNPANEVDQVVGFNPIPSNIEQLDYVLDMLISACLKAWGQDNTDRTPRITKWLENIFYTIIVNDLTLVETPPLLSISRQSQDLRTHLIKNVTNEVVLDDWRMFESSTNTQKQTLIEGAANRLRKFLRNGIIRNIIGQKENSLDFGKIMDEGKILLVNLNGGAKISYENSQLLGIMMVNEIFRSAKLRNPRDPKLKPFYLYIDEFGQFITRDIARALEECRKFKLSLVLAHQHLAQLKKDDVYLYYSVLTNCKNKVVFGGLSSEDAKVMSDEIMTGFVDLKSVKNEMYTTKVRHIEETRLVRSRSSSNTNTKNRSRSISESHQDSFSNGFSDSTGETIGHSKGSTNTWGTSGSFSNTEGHSNSRGGGNSRSRNSTHGNSQSFGQNQNMSNSHSSSENVSTGITNHDSSIRTNRSQGDSQMTGQSYGMNSSESESFSESEGTTYSNSYNQTRSLSRSQQRGSSQSRAQSLTDSFSNQKSHTINRSQGRSEGRSKSDTLGDSQGFMQGESESIVPFLRPEEYQELSSRTFWTKDELHYMEMANIKNQATGEAFIKIGSSKPEKVRISRVVSVSYTKRSPQLIDDFRDQVFLLNQEYYTPVDQAQAVYRERQTAFFGEPLKFDEAVLLTGLSETDSKETDDNDDPFT